MAKTGPLCSRPLVFWFMPITRKPAQKSACKDLKRNGQDRAITFKATYILVYAHNALTGAGIGV
ncbi:Malolactic regulator [Lacticaseibacillus rhamnosus]|nr:Malolactic regulator [Lacticaseibacillus rhamnosus]